ncbi:condensation domain-containing protein [Rhodococcus sp. IEGM 1381]|uniref:condensation domain-containing protein n=1 Tax=Rhodococcus sp. IEGM 1381 TaxID=3047085 RepID=UPI0024B8433F|nr:condensation domain-containing protein [Rhodococcus sp. IEGM 1381]MDI9897259.1 condensation domain-containing protein [Rhodococcus sp. IEGM 1381]
MEYTELADYPLPAGRLTEWVPRVDDDGWASDSRGLSFTHQDHCERSAPGSWIGTVFEIHRRYDVEAVRATIVAYMGRHEAFRTKVRRDEESGAWQRYTAPTDAVRVIDRAHTEPRTETQVFSHLHSWFGETVSPTAWPHFVLATIEPDDASRALSNGPGESFLLAFAADHSVMDAYSQIYAINEIDRLYAQALEGTDPALPEVGSYVDFSQSERELGDTLTSDHSAVRTWQDFLAVENGRFPGFPLPVAVERASTTDGPAAQSSISSWLLTADQSDAVNAACRAAGYNMQAGILAALAVTNARLSGRTSLRTVMPMHTRDEQKWAASVGWYVGILPMEIQLDNARTFGEALEAAAAAGSANKGLARMPYSKIAQILESTEIPRFVVSYIDLRFLPDAAQWQARKGRALRSNCHADDEVYFWVNRTLEGLNISARFPSSDVASTNVHRFITEFVAVLTAVIDSDGGADTVLTSVSQSVTVAAE